MHVICSTYLCVYHCISIKNTPLLLFWVSDHFHAGGITYRSSAEWTELLDLERRCHTQSVVCVSTFLSITSMHVLPMWKSQPLKLGFGFQSGEFLHLTINLMPLDQIQEFVASSHSMFPHSHDLWNLPSHGDIQATDSWKHLALFCSLRQTAQRSSLRSRLAESNIGVETSHNSTKIFAEMWGLSSLSKGWKLLCAESKRTSSRRVKLPPIGRPPGAHSDFLSKRHYGRPSSG